MPIHDAALFIMFYNRPHNHSVHIMITVDDLDGSCNNVGKICTKQNASLYKNSTDALL